MAVKRNPRFLRSVARPAGVSDSALAQAQPVFIDGLGEVGAGDVTVAADASVGVAAGDLQATIVALATRIKALEDAA